jgi:hypothetical protein
MKAVMEQVVVPEIAVTMLESASNAHPVVAPFEYEIKPSRGAKLTVVVTVVVSPYLSEFTPLDKVIVRPARLIFTVAVIVSPK